MDEQEKKEIERLSTGWSVDINWSRVGDESARFLSHSHEKELEGQVHEAYGMIFGGISLLKVIGSNRNGVEAFIKNMMNRMFGFVN